MAVNRTSSLNGFVKNSTAPAFMAWTVMGTSPYPVIKMIGMSVRSTATRFCNSRPLRPGRETSSTRQLGTRALGQERNVCAEENVSGCQPSQRISDSSDSRTETSSSTTNTIGAEPDMDQLVLSYLQLNEDAPTVQGILSEISSLALA